MSGVVFWCGVCKVVKVFTAGVAGVARDPYGVLWLIRSFNMHLPMFVVDSVSSINWQYYRASFATPTATYLYQP